MTKLPHILVVEDDREICALVDRYLRSNECRVTVAGNGREADRAMDGRRIDLVVLDLMLPGEDGLSLCKRLRTRSQVPIIMLTAKSDEADRILGLEMGADDYLTKPFNPRELLARIRAVLRRADAGGAKGESSAERIVRGDLVLDPSRHQCTWKGKEVHLTVTEFLLLKSLAERPGHVKNRDQLMDAAYGETIYVDDRTIDSHIKRVRRKFREVDSEFEQIETLYGIGYRYRDA